MCMCVVRNDERFRIVSTYPHMLVNHICVLSVYIYFPIYLNTAEYSLFTDRICRLVGKINTMITINSIIFSMHPNSGPVYICDSYTHVPLFGPLEVKTSEQDSLFRPIKTWSRVSASRSWYRNFNINHIHS